MSAALMVSISGVRGIVGASFTPEVVVRFVEAFASTFPGKTVVVGRDSRVSGLWVQSLVESTLQVRFARVSSSLSLFFFFFSFLQSCGKTVVSLDIVPTPTVQLAVLQMKASGGGIIVTSSHNPIEWNGLKFVAPDSLFVDPETCAKMYSFSTPVGEKRFSFSFLFFSEMSFCSSVFGSSRSRFSSLRLRRDSCRLDSLSARVAVSPAHDSFQDCSRHW